MLTWRSAPLLSVVVATVASIVPAVAFGGKGAAFSALVLTVFAIANPVLCALSGQWWIATMLSGIAFAVLFVVVGNLPGTTALREGAMVFMIPMMAYPLAVLLSGGLRLVLWSRRRRSA